MLCWRCVDALLTLCWCSFRGVAVLTQMTLPIKAANTSIMDKCCSTALGLYKMQHTKSLTLRWRLFSDWGWNHVTICFAHNGCRYVDSGYMPLESPWIIQDATPKIVDTLLTLYWRCVDALLTLSWRWFWGVAVLTDTILPIQAANTSIMGKCSSISLGLYKMQHT